MQSTNSPQKFMLPFSFENSRLYKIRITFYQDNRKGYRFWFASQICFLNGGSALKVHLADLLSEEKIHLSQWIFLVLWSSRSIFEHGNEFGNQFYSVIAAQSFSNFYHKFVSLCYKAVYLQEIVDATLWSSVRLPSSFYFQNPTFLNLRRFKLMIFKLNDSKLKMYMNTFALKNN